MVNDDILLQGSKGGEEKPHTPVETPNNLLSIAYAKVLVAVGEGEFSGTPTAKNIFLNGTPLENPDGSQNFGGVTWEWRAGTQDQTYIQGMPEASNEISVNTEITQTKSWSQLITKSSLSAVRVTLQWPAIMRQLENGDTVGYTIDYAIDLAVDGGSFVEYQKYQVSGKTNTAYERTHSIKLPESTTSWTVRVRRITPNSQSNLIQDKMNLKSYTEVIDVKQRYPNTALLFVQFDSRLFGGGTIPKISVDVDGRLIRIPSNYDPEMRTYTGIWDGTFKWGFTSNPAWVFFDIVTQDRFGLGSRVSTDQVDKWELYEVAQYCDVMVPNGEGGDVMQPRHTCNMYLASRADAWNVLRDICTIFNGMTYWDGSRFVAIADKLEPTDNIPLFGRSNVIDGEFTYTATDERTIFTSALVSYDEPEDHYGTQVEAVWEKSEILRWGGDRQTTMAAIGCTVRGEAQRKGKYTLLTNMYNRTVTFKTGLQGLDEKVRPGSIIGVADPLIAGEPFTGRIKAAMQNIITLDRPTKAKAGDLLFITLKDGSQQARTVKSVQGVVIETTVAYSEALLPNATWYLESADLKSQLFKVIKLTSPDEGIFELTAVEYNTSKYAAIDHGARLEPRPVSKVPPQAQRAPSPINITSNTFVEQTMAITTMTISYPQTENAVLYEAQWRVGQGDWVDLGTTGGLEYNVRGIFTGVYLARVRAINALGIKSQWALSESTTLNGKDGLPATIASLTTTPLVYGIRLNWYFPTGVEDTAYTQIMYSKTSSFADAIPLGDFAYPQDTHDINGLAAGVTFYFWARLIDRTGNVGPYKPLTSAVGVIGKSSTDVSEYEEYFKGQITDSALGQELAGKIDKIEVIEGDVAGIHTEIDNLETTVGALDGKVDMIQGEVDVLETTVKALDGNVNWLESQLSGIENQLQNDITNVDIKLSDATNQTNNDVEDLKQDVSDLNDQVTIIEGQVAAFVDALEYVPTSSYKKGDAVRQGQKLYQALKDVPVGIAPPNPEYWKDVGDIVTDLGALSAQVSTNTNTITQQGNTITAQGQKLDALVVRVGTAEDKITGQATAISNLETTVTKNGNDIISQGQAITAVKADVANLQTGVEGNASAIQSLRTTVTQQGDLITSQGQAITSLGSEVKALQTDVSGVKSDVLAQGTAITGLTTTVTQQGDLITSHSNSITSLEGKVASITTDLSGLTIKVDANTTAVTNLTSTVTQQGDLITAQGRDITTLKADVTSVTTDVNGLKTTVSGHGTAIGNLETTVTKQGNDITANSTNITKLTAELRFQELENLYDGAETDQQITEALNIATGAASATESLTATVTKQGDVIEANAQRITELDASLTDIDGNIVGVAGAVESLKSTVTAQGDTITSQGSAITQLNNSLTLVDGKATDAQTKADSALAKVETKADASAVTALTTRVTNAEGKIASQGESITQLNNTLTITTNTANAAKTAADKAQTDADAAQATADDAITQLTTKADASAVTSLTTRVEAAEGKITSQGQSITQLNNSLEVTNTNVTAAQQAAQAASDKAGAKGEVIYGSTAPTADKRLPQNLWIDTAGGANTPKRWDGNAWVPVTDKVATDAAKAAADAAALAATKADSSTVTALTNTVTQQGDLITAQGTAMTTIKATLDSTTAKADDALAQVATKADASAVTELKGTVTQQGLDIAANTSNITTLATEVHFNELNSLYEGDETDAQIADAFNIATGAALATESLTSSVTKQGELIEANAQQLTELSTSLTDIDGNIVAQGTAINKLNSITTAQGNTLTQQGNAITSLTSNLATTDAKADDALNKVSTKADATAVTALTTRVTSVEGKVTSQGESITQLNNSLTITNTNVTAAQQAAQAASDKAGLKGEVIYGTTEPATDKRLPQNLWIDTTSNNNTPKRWNGNAWVAVTDKVATDAAKAAADAIALVETKADASAVSSLTTRVTTAEGKITSQGESITGLNNSLTITNGNVTAAQQAAQAASDKAGLKGEVIYGATAPAVDKRLPQNLWIDTANGANTPKRWNGNAWTAVTDKVATDAAQAAANALSVANTKADSSTVQSLQNTVTQQGNTITAQGVAQTAISAKLDTTTAKADDALAKVALKADASAVTKLQGTVTQQGQDIAANTSNITTLATEVHFNELAGLYDGDETDGQIADAFNIASGAALAVTSLTSDVVKQGDRIEANAQSLTELSTSLTDTDGKIVAQGVAISRLNSITTAQGNTLTQQGQSITSLTSSLEVTDGIAKGANTKADNALAQVSTKADASALTSLTTRVTSVEGKVTSQGESITKLTADLVVTTNTANDAKTIAQTKADASALTSLTTRVTAAEGKITSQGQSITQLNNSLTITNGNVTAAQNAANAANTLAGGKGKVFFQNAVPATAERLSQNLWIDTTNGANTPKRWNGSAWVAVTDKVATDAAKAASDAMAAVALKADASALNSLSTTVTQQGNTITAQGTSITQINAKINDPATGLAANAAAISTMDAKVTSIDGKVTAQATKVDGLETELNGAQLAISTNSTAIQDVDGKVSATWSTRLQYTTATGEYKYAGIGLGLENGPGGLQSSFIIDADKFAIGQGDTIPFAVQNGQTFIKSAFIQDASITMLQIGDNLQSTDYVAGVSGWKLSKGGNIEFNGTVAGGGRLTMTNQLIRIYDNNGTLRVRLGIF